MTNDLNKSANLKMKESPSKIEKSQGVTPSWLFSFNFQIFKFSRMISVSNDLKKKIKLAVSYIVII
jgi:hypothetical protein